MTWTLSGFADEISRDLAEQIELLTTLGISHVEFRSAWGTKVLDLTPAQLDEARSMLDAAGIAVSSVGSDLGKILITDPFEAPVTLVKNTDAGVLPISPDKFRRVWIIPISGPKNPMAHGSGPRGADVLADLMRERGYEVDLYESLTEKSERMTSEEFAKVVQGAYAGKAPISAITDNYDLVISVAQVNGLMQPTERVYWPASKGTPDIPWYVHEVPTVFVSVAAPYHLADVPQVKTFVNAYDSQPHTVKAVLDKLEGRSEFTGTPSTDVFCGLPDTRM